ncbi:MAG: ribonuclease HI family protein [Deltaproteobacteria bacterium]
MSAGVKEFLETLKHTLDLKKTMCELDLTEDAARAMIDTIEKSLSKATPFFKGGAGGIDVSGLRIYVDGASRGNPGISGAGAVIKDLHGKTIKKLRKRLGIATNNVAEYSAFVMALREAKTMGASSVHVFADSELLVKQIKGVYKVKSDNLKALYFEAIGLIDSFAEFFVSHIDREKNSEADRLANEAIDGV